MIDQNKIIPDAYVEFVTVKDEGFSVGTRGTVTMALKTNWGETGLKEIARGDLIDGSFKRWFGDTDTLLLKLAFEGCNKILLYAYNTGGNKATKTLDNLTATAQHGGTFGNKISVEMTNTEVITYVEGQEVDRQEVGTLDELIDNDYVTFSGSGSPSEQANTLLTGGSNASTDVDYNNYYKLIVKEQWNVLACTDKKMNEAVKTLIDVMRNEELIKVQAVMVDDDADNLGIIKLTEQKVIYNHEELKAEQIASYVAGITAGASITDSNTNRETPFTGLVDKLLRSEIQKALLKGYFVFTMREDGLVTCVSDINSLTTYNQNQNSDFSKNKIIRIMDEFNNTIRRVFRKTYMGKIPNSESGRLKFKSSLIGYMNELVELEALDPFDANDISVEQGKKKNAIIVKVKLKPVDAVEFLYLVAEVE